MKMRKQRRIGLALLVVSVLLAALVSGAGSTPEECDATGILITAPLGVYMIFTPHYILCDAAEYPQQNERSLELWQENE